MIVGAAYDVNNNNNNNNNEIYILQAISVQYRIDLHCTTIQRYMLVQHRIDLHQQTLQVQY